MSQRSPGHTRAALSSLLVLIALLTGALRAPAAAAEVAANPDPALIARWEPCEANAGVTVIVDEHEIGAGMIYVGCALGEQANGVQALEDAGFALEGTTAYGLAFVCRIDGEPTPAEQPCTTTPGAGAYWSYWRGKPGGRWSYSPVSAKSPETRSPVNSVEGWSFGAGSAPRIEPMDASGPSSFRLPPPQQSSVIPALLAREWLAPVLEGSVGLAEELEAEELSEHPEAERLLLGAIALARAGVEPARMKSLAAWLAHSCTEKKATVEGCPLRELANPNAAHGEQKAERFALAVLGLQALGLNPSSFAGMDLRGTLEGMVKNTGKVESEGKPSSALEVTAPTVLALARTGPLPAKALKTIDLILAQQEASTGSLEATTAANVEAIEALVAAREQGASVLEDSRLENIQAALARAGGYLESIQEPEGGVRRQQDASPVFDPDVESTALAAVGLALSGRRAAAERAAQWVSRFQVTSEYAGSGNPETGEHTPAEGAIGAFLPSEAALRNALAFGVASDERYGPYAEAQLPTIDALLALVTAGPYGPYDVAFEEQSLLFETREVGSQSRPLTVALSNHDVRPVTIAAVSVLGDDAGDFTAEGGTCTGRTLAPGASCELSASFDPRAGGLREALLAVTLDGSAQTLELPLAGNATPASEHEPPQSEPEPTAPEPVGPGHEPSKPGQGSPETPAQTASTGTASQGVLASRIASPLRVQAPVLDGLGAPAGLVGVSWQVLEGADELGSWTISSQTLGLAGAGYVPRATGGASTSAALLKLPPGAAYELRITFADLLGDSSSVQIGKVLVPHDDRWSALHYGGPWRRLEQPGAWLDTITRGTRGARLSMRLGAGRPVFIFRGTSTASQVEIRAGSHRQLFAIDEGPAGVSRQITAAARSTGGTVSLVVLKGEVDLDGVAVEG